jgi:phage shock protein B
MDEVFIPLIAIATLFLGLPWLVFHYITKWKTAATLSGSDEKLLDELHDMARRLDDRLCSIERIMTAENPNWRQQCLPDQSARLDDQLDRMNESMSRRTLHGETR